MSNTLTNVTPKMLAQGVLALREHAILPRLVNTSYNNLAAMPGAVISVPIPSAIAARDVTAQEITDSNIDSSPTVALVTLDFWKEAPFHLTDSDDLTQIGFIPMQASEAIKSLCNAVDSYILGKHVGIFSHNGAASTTPFATNLVVAGSARTALNGQLAPVDDRFCVIDAAAEGNLLLTDDVLHANLRGDAGGIIKGTVGTKLGVAFYMDQNIPSYSPGVGWVTGHTFKGISLAGTSTISVVPGAGAGAVKVGDIFAWSGEQYVSTQAASWVSGTAVSLTIYPPLKDATVSADAFTCYGATAYTVNIMAHRDAFAWASRPLGGFQALGNLFQSATDPVSGCALRLEVSRQHKQTTFSYDILGGAGLVRRELATKILG